MPVISLGNVSTVAFCISNGYFTTNEIPEKPYVTVLSNEKCLDMIDNGTGAVNGSLAVLAACGLTVCVR